RSHPEHALRISLVQVHPSVSLARRGPTLYVRFEDEYRARLGPPVEGVQHDQSVEAIQKLLDQADPGDAAFKEAHARCPADFLLQPTQDFHAEAVIAPQHVADAGD